MVITKNAALALACVIAAHAGTAKYETTDENFANPERGFYIQSAYHPRPGRASPGLDAAALKKNRETGISLIRMYYVISEFRDKPLSEAMLARIEADFAAIRAAGMKVIPRFAYNFGPQGEPDASLERILEHLGQLKPALRKNSDVIAFLEAGFIGTWGEWHHSTNGLLNEDSKSKLKLNDASRAIVSKLLEVLPPDRMIALRYPRSKMEMFGPEPISAAEAFSQIAKARIGAHNDCFLASKTNWGTYTKNIENERQFYQTDNLYVPMGGETCNAKEDAQPFIGCSNALAELQQLHFNTLNIGYHKEVLDGWRTEGCMPEIQRRLGYRFRLVESDASDMVAPGGEFRLTFSVRNDGFGNLYNKRPLEIVMRPARGGKDVQIATSVDPRRWSAGETSVVKIVASLPKSTAPGDYDIYLWLPDADSRLRDRPEFAIRFANPGMGALNRLAHKLTVRRR